MNVFRMNTTLYAPFGVTGLGLGDTRPHSHLNPIHPSPFDAEIGWICEMRTLLALCGSRESGESKNVIHASQTG